MNENGQKLNALAAALLIFSSVMGVVVLGRGHSGTSRPPENAAVEAHPVAGSQTVPNRLWQDPFEAIEQLTNKPAEKPDVSALARLCKARGETEHTTVLAVFLEGKPYPEDKETRRRLRYAVELALLTSDFAPNDRNHIGIEHLDLNQPDGTNSQKLAFEWFTPISAGLNKALILWLPEEDFLDRPLDRLRLLREALGLEDTRSEFIVIGPRSSDTLRSMALNAPPSGMSHFRILSPYATVSDVALFKEAANASPYWFQRDGSPPIYERWIATDQELSRRIVEELELREIPDKSREGEVVVLISEADTFYGRSLPVTLEKALTAGNGFPRTNVWHFKYLRGLEGIKPAQPAQEEEQKQLPATPEAAFQAALTRRGEKAEGEGQQDYARRFAAFLKSKENRYGRAGTRIRAIGLTGSDFYDKLVLLQALRSQFSEAVFFTTDLEAGYWSNPEQLAYTKNLLVASSYPLEPELAGLRSQFMPFRTVYQASAFAACLAALQPAKIARTDRRLFGDVYEIGRHGPVRLALKNSSQNSVPQSVLATAKAALAQLWSGVYLAIMGAVILTSAFLTLVLRAPLDLEMQATASSGGVAAPLGGEQRKALAVATAIAEGETGSRQRTAREPLAQASGGGGQRSFEEANRRTGFVGPSRNGQGRKHGVNRKWRGAWRLCAPAVKGMVIALVFLAGAAASQFIANSGSEEPWRLSDGVSMWPTEAIRVTAAILAVWFFVSALTRGKRHNELLWEKFFKPGMSPKAGLTAQTDKVVGRSSKRTARSRWGRLIILLYALVVRDCKLVWNRIFTAGKAPCKGRPALSWALKLASWLYSRVTLGPWHIEVQRFYANAAPLNATELFKGYDKLGRAWKRGLRLCVNLALLFFGLGVVFYLLNDIPSRWCVRGPLSRQIDSVVLGAAVIGFYAVLFYAIDATRLAARMLTYLEHPTVWPDWRKEKAAGEWCLCKDDTDPLLDMQFAIKHTQHVRTLMLYPFLLLLLLLISRLSFFEAWTWPMSLNCVFLLNLVLAATCWAALRRSAYRVRTAAIRQLSGRALECENAALLRHRRQSILPAIVGGVGMVQSTAMWIQSGTADYPPEKYAERLRQMIDSIKNERGGAFAPWIQDPTYLFLFIPTGVTGLLTVGLHFMLN